MAQVSLEITERLLTLQLAGADAGAPPLLQLTIPDNADHAAAAAKFSKKKRKLTVTLPTLA